MRMTSLHPLLVECFRSAGYDPSSISLTGTIATQTQTGERFFAKTGRNVLQMQGEYESLRAMSKTAPTLVPRLIGLQVDESGTEAGMVSQYFDLSSSRQSSTQEELARKLAEMHKPQEGIEKYGFDVPTHCGVTEQDKTWEEDWMVFFRDRRLGDLVRRIRDKEISSAWEKIRDV